MTAKKPEKRLTAILYLLLALMLPAACFLSAVNIKNTVSARKSQAAEAAYSIVIDVDQNRLYLLKDGCLFKSYSCATGAPETPSPIGSFKIIKKAHWGEGFGGYYLGLNCTWGTYGIHGTRLPASIGYDSSHGCFRMYNSDIEELYGYVCLNTPVYVAKGTYGIFGRSFRALGPGMYGSDVLAVQKRLKEFGFYRGRCNGRYDAAGFSSAVHKFQKMAGLPVSDYVTKRMYESLGFILIE